jgi:hypothetical protein
MRYVDGQLQGLGGGRLSSVNFREAAEEQATKI